ncbi:EPIDERMAL PATTERNING FACTOR-like protein 3 [Jatropha curcas]|uniref:EPIDERMAL PATTERNING FACTOR-like protein 3 n=1 Tax=Jatropha curcas TaxID=180498 RepID=UPI0005FAB8A2|nr:EPIDERMAL PATTERNING FACTOR-like protein 3 [Jatropha curcas]XP_037493157.1 EPIDERMAL PATTERNING FACTOR-like protein 3 [Jatropha curcas]
MRRRICFFIIASLQIITWWCCVASWQLSSHDPAAPRQGQIPQFQQAAFGPNQGTKRINGVAYGKEQSFRGLSRLGSTPPNCENKCKGCVPCNAIQIPATTDRKRVEYANYEPEGWKCKCGSTFFNP